MFGVLDVVDDVPGEFSEHVIEAFHRRRNDTFSLFLSGGETARACYERLAVEALHQIDWWKVDIYWGDERCVPLDDPASNCRLGHEALLTRVGAANTTHPMVCESGVDSYQRVITKLEAFDLVHLGLGPDGHTASLFAASPALQAPSGCLVSMNEDPSGRNPYQRMTLTLEGISRAHLVLVTVVGSEKRDALARVVSGDTSAPAANVRAKNVIWLADPAAAGDLARD